MHGHSDVRIAHVDTGHVEKSTKMDAKWFGEGLVKLDDKLYQIAWQVCCGAGSGPRQSARAVTASTRQRLVTCNPAAHLKSNPHEQPTPFHPPSPPPPQVPNGFIYSAKDLSLLGTFKTPLRDGWGVTSDGELLVLSDGTSKLTWVDPNDGFSKVKALTVTDGGRQVGYLNEVSWMDGWMDGWMGMGAVHLEAPCNLSTCHPSPPSPPTNCTNRPTNHPNSSR